MFTPLKLTLAVLMAGLLTWIAATLGWGEPMQAFFGATVLIGVIYGWLEHRRSRGAARRQPSSETPRSP